MTNIVSAARTVGVPDPFRLCRFWRAIAKIRMTAQGTARTPSRP